MGRILIADREWIAALLSRVHEQFELELALLLSLDDDQTLRVEVTSAMSGSSSVRVGDEFAGSLAVPVQPDDVRGSLPAHEYAAITESGVPVAHPDGTCFGLLCRLPMTGCKASPETASVMTLVSDLITERLSDRPGTRADLAHLRRRMERLIAGRGPRIVLQGVVRLADYGVDGWEALSRFPDGWPTPDRCFAEAHSVGLGVELELLAIRKALAARATTRRPELSLGVNVSPAALLSTCFLDLIAKTRPTHLVVELTEHEQIRDYTPVRAVREALRDLGVTVAADDTGAGYAGLRHLVELRPDLIKLDRSIVADIDVDPARRAIARAMVNFAHEMEMVTIAEGIETVGELRCCAEELGLQLGQGYLLHKPGIARAGLWQEATAQASRLQPASLPA